MEQITEAVEHPLGRCVSVIQAALKDVIDVDPLFAPVAAKREVLLGLTRLAGQLEALRMSVIAGSSDVAEAEAVRGVGAWLTPRVLTDPATQAAAQNLACDLALYYPVLQSALAQGRANLPQTRVIRRCLNELRRLEGVTSEIITMAEEFLVDSCASLPPAELKRLADGVLEHLDPEVFDEAERRKLEDELRRARAETRVRMRRRGDGTTDIHARVPDAMAVRLKTYLESFTAPRNPEHQPGSTNDHEPAREKGTAAGDAGDTEQDDTGEDAHGAGTTGDADTRADSDADAAGSARAGAGAAGSLSDAAISGSRFRDPATGERLPYDRMLGEAFCALLERIDPQALPRHGGAATTLVITTQLDALTGQLGNGTLTEGTRLPAGEVRRLACTAGILPAVLDGDSKVLDLGGTRRLFTTDQRRALGLTHRTCQASGCTIPSTWCEAHHREPWSRGGPTDLANGMLLCSYHHQRIHDDAYLVKHLANGDVRYTRRT